MLLSDLFSEFFIQTFPNRCEFGSRKQHVPGAPGRPGLPARCPAGALARVSSGSAAPRALAEAGTGAGRGGAGAQRGAARGPRPSTMRPRRREPRAPPQQLCTASPAARPRPSARSRPRPPPRRPPPLTVAELEQRGCVVQAAVAREAVLHAEAAGQRPLPRPGRAAAAHPHTEPRRAAAGAGAGAGPAVAAAAAGYHGNPGPAAAAALARRPLCPPGGGLRGGRGRAGTGRGGDAAGRGCRVPGAQGGARPGPGCCGSDAARPRLPARSLAPPRRAGRGGRGDKGEAETWERARGERGCRPGQGNPSCGRRRPRSPGALSPRPRAAPGPNMYSSRAHFGCLSTSQQLRFWPRPARLVPLSARLPPQHGPASSEN